MQRSTVKKATLDKVLEALELFEGRGKALGTSPSDDEGDGLRARVEAQQVTAASSPW